MTKRKVGISLLLTTALAGTGYGVLQDEKVEQLEKQVKSLDARLAKVESYVQQQAKSFKAFGSALDAAVTNGFVAGINFESRKILVGGLRKIVDSAKNAPVAGKSPPKHDPKRAPMVEQPKKKINDLPSEKDQQR